MERLLKAHFESEEWLKDLFDDAHDLIQIVHLDGTLIYVNKSWHTLLELDREEIQGQSLYSFIDEADLPHYIHYRNEVINGSTTDKEIGFRLKTRSGKKVSVEGFVSVKMIEGIPIYTRGIFRDVTTKLKNEAQLKRLNQELKEREQNLQQLLVNAPDAVIVIDQESHITFWNPKAEDIFGWTAQEVMHQPLSTTIIPVQHREAHEKGMKRYLATGEVHILNKTIEITALNKAGNEFYISLTISRTAQGGETAFIAFIRNITEQKNNQLELERKTKELERSNTNLEEFAYAASHDLKEPIRKILTFSDRLKEGLKGKLEDRDIQFFRRMENAAYRMGSLIDDLLTYSSVSRGINYWEEVNLKQNVEMVLEDLELEIQEKGAQITLNALPVIKGHKRQLQQLFQNLIGNALKYSKPGIAPQIDIHARIVSGNDMPLNLPAEDCYKRFYLIAVKDNGIGFSQEDAERIFNVFTRLHGNAEYRGTGVGLSIARKVIDNYKGYIWAESTPGEGSTFKILLPAD